MSSAPQAPSGFLAPVDTPPPRISAFAPLSRPVFRWLFVANVVSNIGSAIHDVGAGWLMTTLSPSAVMVALVQAAATFPLFLFALPAGALADVADRRRLLLGAQIVMALVAAALCALTLASGAAFPPVLLLLLTLGLGLGAAMANPAWQTAMTDLVPREELPAAASLNSVSMNLSRAIGPGIGGLLVASMGPQAAFALNALSFLGIIAVLAFWKYRKPAANLPPETFTGAVRAGVRYVRHAPQMRAVLVRTAGFVLFASSLWALLPLIARNELNLGPGGYGLLLSCLGAGAVTATLILPRLRARFAANPLIVGATCLYAASAILVALTGSVALSCIAMAVAGSGWVTMVTTLNVAAQTGAPTWVRARALACYLTVFYGGMAAGSAVWGFVATHYQFAGLSGIATALILSAIGLLFALATLPFSPLRPGLGRELEYDRHWRAPEIAATIPEDAGPVLITVEYAIDPSNFAAFAAAMEAVGRTRYRDGARTWHLTQDTGDPTRWVELFTVDSWAEHLRQHDRVTVADRRIQEHAKGFHKGPVPPRVSHLIALGDAPLSHAAHDPHPH